MVDLNGISYKSRLSCANNRVTLVTIVYFRQQKYYQTASSPIFTPRKHDTYSRLSDIQNTCTFHIPRLWRLRKSFRTKVL